MSNIIKNVAFAGVSLVLIVIFTNRAVAKNNFVKIISNAEVVLSTEREKLDKAVVSFQTKKEEKIEKQNKKRLNNYKNRLIEANFVQGEQGILVTGYSSTPDQCWGNPFRTASGTHVHQGTMACPPQYPFGTKIEIDNLGIFICEDRGGAIKGNHFDMWFTSRNKALAWGKRVVVAKISK